MRARCWTFVDNKVCVPNPLQWFAVAINLIERGPRHRCPNKLFLLNPQLWSVWCCDVLSVMRSGCAFICACEYEIHMVWAAKCCRNDAVKWLSVQSFRAYL